MEQKLLSSADRARPDEQSLLMDLLFTFHQTEDPSSLFCCLRLRLTILALCHRLPVCWDWQELRKLPRFDRQYKFPHAGEEAFFHCSTRRWPCQGGTVGASDGRPL